MDMTKLKKLAGIAENAGPMVGVGEIAEHIYTLAESRVADTAGDQNGTGYDRNAVKAQVHSIFAEIFEIIDYKLRNDKF